MIPSEAAILRDILVKLLGFDPEKAQKTAFAIIKELSESDYEIMPVDQNDGVLL